MQPWLIGLVVSVVLFLVSVSVEFLQKEWARKVNISVIIFLAGTSIGFAIDQRLEMSDMKREIIRALNQQEIELRNLVPLLSSIEDVDLATLLREIVGSHNSLKDRPEALLAPVLRDRFFELGRTWFELSDGRIRLDGEELAWFSILAVRHAQISIDATNVVEYSSWWENAMGRKYLSVNKEKAGRIRIRRIFLFENRFECESKAPRIEDQQKAGVEIFVALLRDIPEESQGDVLIIDDQVAGQMKLSEKRTSEGATVYSDKINVDDIRSIFATSLERSRGKWVDGGCSLLD